MKLTTKKKRENTLEQGTFTPLVFSATGGMGRECSMFFEKLSQLISIKRKEELSVATYGIRCKIVLHHYEVAYYVYEGVENQIMNMKN